MKPPFSTDRKDNIAAAILLAATFIAIAGSIVTSNNAHADKAPQMEIQRMEAIIITAPRLPQVVRLETIVVTASRHTKEAAKILVASE